MADSVLPFDTGLCEIQHQISKLKKKRRRRKGRPAPDLDEEIYALQSEMHQRMSAMKAAAPPQPVASPQTQIVLRLRGG
jgi:hypothetical protein